MPVPKADLTVSDGDDDGLSSYETPLDDSRVEDANNPDNFRLAWHVWDDYPYRKANLIEGPNPEDKGGFGPPTHTVDTTIFEMWLGSLSTHPGLSIPVT